MLFHMVPRVPLRSTAGWTALCNNRVISNDLLYVFLLYISGVHELTCRAVILHSYTPFKQRQQWLALLCFKIDLDVSDYISVCAFLIKQIHMSYRNVGIRENCIRLFSSKLRFIVTFGSRGNSRAKGLLLCMSLRKDKTVRKWMRKKACQKRCAWAVVFVWRHCSNVTCSCIKGNGMIYLVQGISSVCLTASAGLHLLSVFDFSTFLCCEDEESSLGSYSWTSCCCPFDTS